MKLSHFSKGRKISSPLKRGGAGMRIVEALYVDK
jgi:hypothetical protein